MLLVSLASVPVQGRMPSVSPSSPSRRCAWVRRHRGEIEPQPARPGGLSTSTYGKLTQIRFGRGRVLFCCHHVLVIKMPLLIKIHDSSTYTVDVATLMKRTVH